MLCFVGGKYRMACICTYCVFQNSPSALSILCVPLIHPLPSILFSARVGLLCIWERTLYRPMCLFSSICVVMRWMKVSPGARCRKHTPQDAVLLCLRILDHPIPHISPFLCQPTHSSMTPVLLVRDFITFNLCMHVLGQFVGLSSLLPLCGFWIKLRSLGLVPSSFTCRAVLPAPALCPLKEKNISSS